MMKTRTNYLPPTFAPVPWLVVPHGECGKKLRFFNVFNAHSTFIRKAPKQIRGKDCETSVHGWVLMIDPFWDQLQGCLWNPITQEIYELPRLDVVIDYGVWAVASPSKKSGLMVLFAGEDFFLSWQIGDHRWTKQGYELKGDGDDHPYISYIYSFKDGKLFALTSDRKFALIEKDSSGDFSVSLLNEFAHPVSETSVLREYYVELCGDVYLVELCFGGRCNDKPLTIGIFKMDFAKEAFFRVKCIGDHIFFVSRSGCTSFCATKLGLKGNCIYVPLQKELYRFDLEDESISMSLPSDMLPTSFTPFWFVPDNRSIDFNDDADKEKEITTTREILNADCVEESGGPLLTDLSSDIIHKISTRLCLAVDYLNFRHVSKTIRLSVPPIQLATQYPLLIFSNKRESRCSFSDPIKNFTCSFDMPELLGAKIRFSQDGWLLMSRDDKSPFFFNPFTQAIHDLPDLPQASDCHIGTLAFSSIPTSPDCVVLATGVVIGYIEMYFVQPGQHEWSYVQIENEEWFFPSTASPVFHDGAFYFLGTRRFLGVFNTSDKSWTLLQTPRPCCSIQQGYLLECCGELTAVFMGCGGRYVQAYRFDRANMNWQRITDLKDQAFFLSRTRSMSLKVISESMKNRIYFPISFKDNYLSYSLETLRWHSSFADYCKEDACNTSEKLQCTWIQPSYE